MRNPEMICLKCGKRKAERGHDLCKICHYRDMVEYMASLPADEQEWTSAICEECGTHLDNNGDCPNTWCGNSPYQGTGLY